MIHDPYFPPDSKPPSLVIYDPYFPPDSKPPSLVIHDPYFPPDSKPPSLVIHDPYFPPDSEPPAAPPGEPPYGIPDGTGLPESTAELVKHCFMIFDSELVEPVADEINFPGRAIPRLIRSKLAAICSDLDRYHWRVYASKLDYCSISITAYGTPK